MGYKVIQATLVRLVAGHADWDNFKSLDTLGIDEIALKKGHEEYMTIISARLNDGRIRVLAVIEGRGKADIKSFFESIPPRLQKTVKSVCTLMHDAFVYATIEVFGPQAVVIDRYHVAKLYRKPLDKLRIKEMKRLKSELDSDEYAKLEGMMWILRKQHECRSDADKLKEESQGWLNQTDGLKRLKKVQPLVLMDLFQRWKNTNLTSSITLKSEKIAALLRE